MRFAPYYRWFGDITLPRADGTKLFEHGDQPDYEEIEEAGFELCHQAHPDPERNLAVVGASGAHVLESSAWPARGSTELARGLYSALERFDRVMPRRSTAAHGR